MDETSIVGHITQTFHGVEAVDASGDTWFFYNPDRIASEHKMPFATLVTGDRYDNASNLDRPSVFRLNIGVGKKAYISLFGPPPPANSDGSVVDTGHDYTAVDKIMPHPIYAPMCWICVLSPSNETFQSLLPLLEDAYGVAVSRRTKLKS